MEVHQIEDMNNQEIEWPAFKSLVAEVLVVIWRTGVETTLHPLMKQPQSLAQTNLEGETNERAPPHSLIDEAAIYVLFATAPTKMTCNILGTDDYGSEGVGIEEDQVHGLTLHSSMAVVEVC